MIYDIPSGSVCAYEYTTGGRSGTIDNFPKGAGKRKERPTAANRLSPTGPCPQIKIPFW
jgi:hypothetical protein